MSEFNKYSTDGGATFIDVEDSNAVHYGDQSKGYVGKNLLPYPYAESSYKNNNGIEYLVDNDGIITIDGTATAATAFWILKDTGANLQWLNGKIISGCEGGGYSNSYKLVIGLDESPWSEFTNQYSGNDVIISGIPNDSKKVCVKLLISSGASVSNEKIYPMIRSASISDKTYEPYLTPNTEIVNKASWVANNAVSGSHNLLEWKNSSNNVIPAINEINGVTFTRNKDYSITLSGGSATSEIWYIPFSGILPVPVGTKLKISGEIRSRASIYIADNDDSDNIIATGKQPYFINNGHRLSFVCNVKSGEDFTTPATFKPMILLSDDTYTEYTPPKKILKQLEVDNSVTYTSKSLVIKYLNGVKQIHIFFSGYTQSSGYQTITTLEEIFRTESEILKRIIISGTNYAYLRIKTNGEVQLNTNVTNAEVYIDETFI